MNNQKNIEKYYTEYTSNIKKFLPDGLVTIDLDMLHHLDLLHYHSHNSEENNLTRYFQVTETEDKLTLVNEEFVIWIIPSSGVNGDCTLTLVALNGKDDLHLELGFITNGVYNQSFLILKILEKMLLEIHTTEDLLKKIG